MKAFKFVLVLLLGFSLGECLMSVFWRADIERDRKVIADLRKANEALRFKFSEAHMWAETCEARPTHPDLGAKGKESLSSLVPRLRNLNILISCRFEQEKVIARTEGQAGLEPGWLKKNVTGQAELNMEPVLKLPRHKQTIVLMALAAMPNCARQETQ